MSRPVVTAHVSQALRVRSYHARPLLDLVPVAVRACSSPDAVRVTISTALDGSWATLAVCYPACLAHPRVPRGHWFDAPTST